VPIKLIYPKEIIKKLKSIYNRADHLKAYLSDEEFNISIKFKRLSEKEIEENFRQISNWIEELKKSHLNITFQNISYRSLGEQSIPQILDINQDVFLQLLSKQKVFKEHLKLIEKILYKFPKLKTLLILKPKILMEYNEVWKQLLIVCNYFISNPRPNLYIRELDIKGIDSKFIEKYKKILDLMLSTILDKPIVKLAQNGFEKKYNLKYDLPTIRFRILDEALYICGLSDISLPLNEFMKLDIKADKIFITENKINGLTFPKIKNSIVIFGLGYGVDSLKNIEWIKSKNKIYYWGDIDTHGFAILSQIRSYFPNIKSILMDIKTLNRYKYLSVLETKGREFLGQLEYLTDKEEILFEELKKGVYGNKFRLEQERIDIESLKKILS